MNSKLSGDPNKIAITNWTIEKVENVGGHPQGAFIKLGGYAFSTFSINLLEPNSKKGIDYYDTIHDQKLKSLRYT